MIVQKFLHWAAQFNIPVVLLAVVICAAGSFTVMALLARALVASGRMKWVWLAGVCIGFGADVWATHFIAMLAFDPNIPFAYRTAPTILSVLIAIAGSAVPLALVIRWPGVAASTIPAGALLGLTIGAMHFTGMSAMRMGVRPLYDPAFSVIGIGIGMVFSVLALRAAGRLDRSRQAIRAAAFLMLAICGLHFTAMGGFSVTAAHAMPQAPVGAPLEITTAHWLAVSIAGVSGLILLAAFGTAVMDQKIHAMRLHEAESLHYSARHDALTRLPNRQLLMEHFADATAPPDGSSGVALLYLDLDRFKPVNELFGHHAGDMALIIVAERINIAIRESEVAARLGADEFIILQRDGGQPAAAAALAERLVHTLAEPLNVAGTSVRIGASIGIVVSPPDGQDFEDLLRNADAALHRAKTLGGNGYCFFEPEMARNLLALRSLELEFHQAMEAGEFVLHYQPVFDCASSRLAGFEALLRWAHPARGLIPPTAFIPFAEKSGSIVKLGIWVLEAACAAAAAWPGDLRVAVNVSAVQLRGNEFPAHVSRVLQTTGLAPAQLELEVTETALMENPEQAGDVLKSLKACGVKLALDDFGTGYSSLGYLRRFSFDRLKIDRSFMQNLETDEDSAAIVRAIIGLGRALRIDVTAEGVETEGQLRMLRKEKCQQVQGYLLGKPMAWEAIGNLIQLDTVG